MQGRLSKELVWEKFTYDPDSGELRWRRTGKLAGTYGHTLGYVNVGLNYKLYKAHRIIWLYVYGDWPDEDIDHIDRDRANNRISNLRKTTRSQNLHNSALRSNNSSGYVGVSLTPSGSYRAYVNVNKKRINLGYYPTAAEAAQARKDYMNDEQLQVYASKL